MNIEAKLGADVFAIDKEPHITVNRDVCRARCRKQVCITICPAHLYTLNESGDITLNYEGCLECGACKLACADGALTWRYPRDGFGVQYRLG